MGKERSSKRGTDHSFDFFTMATTSMTNPIMTTIGATVMRRALKISGFQTAGSSDPPPAIRAKPMKITTLYRLASVHSSPARRGSRSWIWSLSGHGNADCGCKYSVFRKNAGLSNTARPGEAAGNGSRRKGAYAGNDHPQHHDTAEQQTQGLKSSKPASSGTRA